MTDKPHATEGLAAGLAELLPCPFCGETPRLHTGNIPVSGAFIAWVQCHSARCFGPVSSNYGNSPDAIAAWNRRAPASSGETGGLVRYAFEKPTGGLTLLPMVRPDGEWVKFADVAALSVPAVEQAEPVAPNWIAEQVIAASQQRKLPMDREFLGREVRTAWIRWAEHQPSPKPSWLVPWKMLPEADKEADRLIGEWIAYGVLDWLSTRDPTVDHRTRLASSSPHRVEASYVPQITTHSTQAIEARNAVVEGDLADAMREAVRFISNIDNSHPSLRVFRAALRTEVRQS